MDVGAHCGYFAMTCAMKGAKRVYAYEPYKPNYETLLKNVETFRDIVIPFNQGVWFSDEIFKMTHPDFKDKFYDYNSVKLEEKGDFDQGYFTRFDKIVSSLPEKPNLLKLNTRNYDLQLLIDSVKIPEFDYICGEAKIENPARIEEVIKVMKEKGFEQSFFKINDEEGTNQFIFGKDKEKTGAIFDLYS